MIILILRFAKSNIRILCFSQFVFVYTAKKLYCSHFCCFYLVIQRKFLLIICHRIAWNARDRFERCCQRRPTKMETESAKEDQPNKPEHFQSHEAKVAGSGQIQSSVNCRIKSKCSNCNCNRLYEVCAYHWNVRSLQRAANENYIKL